MNIPVEVSYRGVEKTEQLEGLIEEQKEKLDKLSDRINSCRVSVELDQKSRHTANVYRVRLDLTINHGNEIPVVEKTRGDDENPGVEPLIRKAFETAKRQVIKLKERQNKDVKSHPDQSVRGIVKLVFPDQGYGFIQSLDGEEIYFHRNSVAGNKFDHISAGTGVSYSAETGDKGLQATVVHVKDKPSL